MKNNLSSECIKAALSAAKVGIVGLHVLGTAGGGPGAFEVAVDKFDCIAVDDPNKALSKKILSAFVDAL
jgi:hypothetical protein